MPMFTDRLQKAVTRGIAHGKTTVTLKLPTVKEINTYGDVIYSEWIEEDFPALVIFHPSRELLDDLGYTDSAVTVVFISAEVLLSAGIVDKLELGSGDTAQVSLAAVIEINEWTLDVTEVRRVPFMGNETLMYIFSGKVKEVV